MFGYGRLEVAHWAVAERPLEMFLVKFSPLEGTNKIKLLRSLNPHLSGREYCQM